MAVPVRTPERLHAGWWVAILGGLAALAVVAFHPRAYAWWAAHVTAVFASNLLRAVFAIALVLHLGEALYASRLARRLGDQEAAARWFWQTLALGFPSLRLLRRRVRAQASR
jgi:hypothetical protein